MVTCLAITPFGEWLSDMLREERETAASLARGAHVAQSSISAYLSGPTRPTYENVVKIARHWGKDPAEVWKLVERTPTAPPPSDDVIIADLRTLLAEMSPEEQRELALPPIESVARLLRRLRREGR